MISNINSADDVRFMNDSTEAQDGAKEAIMDYVVSWTLRRAQNVCAGEKPVLYKYCRRFLGLLLKQEIKNDDVVTVETWKQYNKIDVWAYVTVNGIQHDILIEDKYYSSLKGNQLARYKDSFDVWLDNNRPDSKRHYLVLTCIEKDDVKSSIYKSSEFPVIYWDDMINAMKCCKEGVSESDIFNEFWINW